MRVSQIQNVTWVGNVLVLGGLVWIGLQFWQVRRAKTTKEIAWPATKAVEDPNARRWPGDVKNFEHIASTYVNGKPPPPPQKAAAVVQLDRETEFKSKVKFQGCFELPESPEQTTVRLSYNGKDVSVTPGGKVAESDFQLLACTYDEKTRGWHVMFRNPDTSAPFTIDVVPPPATLPNGPVLAKSYPPGVKPVEPPAESAPLEATAWLDPVSGAWIIPPPEQEWIETWGKKDIWDRLAARPDVDAAGVSHGLKITSPIEPGTPLAPSHGIGQGDVIRSINGVPITSKEEVLDYLRGPGKGLVEYKVVVDTGGKERTIVYRVPKPRR